MMTETRKELVSIIVPVFNAEDYLPLCIDSICRQSYQEIELILIDDGSTDGSGKLCDTYAKKDSRIIVIHQDNSGTVAARKRGLAEARGKYAGFVDADDWIEPEMYEFLVSEMQMTQSDLAQIQIVGRETEEKSHEVIEFHQADRAEMIRKRLFTDGTVMTNLFSKLFLMEKIKDAFSRIPMQQQYGEDLLCLLHYLNTSTKLFLGESAFYHYRMMDGSVSHKKWEQMCLESSMLYVEIKKTLEEYGQWEVCRESVASYYRSLLFEYLRGGFKKDNLLERYRFSNTAELAGERIVLYGAGKVGTDYYKQIVCNEKQEIVAWIDKNPIGSVVHSLDCLKELEYDCILVAVAKEEVAEEIRESLLDSGLCDDPAKIIWKEPERLW